MKPKNCIYPDCLNCQYTDCRYNDLERLDEIKQDEFDSSLANPEVLALRARQKRYERTCKARERRTAYESTDKAKERHLRYLQSEKGKSMLKRKQQKRIESGKNAEQCRRYRLKKKMQSEVMMYEQSKPEEIQATATCVNQFGD